MSSLTLSGSKRDIRPDLDGSPATDAAVDFLNEVLAGGDMVEQTHFSSRQIVEESNPEH
jgi:hypothetical protein